MSFARPSIIALVVVFSPLAKADLATLTLEQVYALPIEQVEKEVYELGREQCEALINTVDPENDPVKLTKSQLCAVQNYTGASFEDINKHLWLTETKGAAALNGAEWGFVRVLDEALNKMPSMELTVYSGTSQRHMKFTKKGEVKRFRGYTSTSTSEESAMSFMSDRMMVIKLKSGKNLLRYSNDGLEAEILLPRSAKLRFDARKIKSVEHWTEEGPIKKKVEYLYLTEVP